MIVGAFSLPTGERRDGALATGGPPELLNGINVDGNYSIQSLVEDIFVKGGCKNISNIKSIGPADGIGYFDNGGEVIGIDEGIIFATGPIGNALGPNENTETSGELNSGGDGDLDRLASADVSDAVGFEFDFVPLDSLVTFRYVFASEEYCEYAGSKFNDVFGFFISGPGINGSFSDNGENVALLPGTNDYVSINSVNHLNNSEYYISNELREDARSCNKPFAGTSFASLIEYDGFTRVLTATLRLEPCQTYHLRLVVGDVSDNLFDSAVFLEAESFNIGGSATVAAETTIDPEAVLEGCPNGQFVFQRVDEETIDQPLEVNFELSSASTAEEGVDFDPLPRTVFIPAGAMTAELPVQVISDGVEEAPETILLELSYPCDCVTGQATMTIADPPPIELSIPDVETCQNTEAVLAPEISGGTPPFTFSWSDGTADSLLSVTVAASTAYTLNITDACGLTATRQGRVEVVEPPRAEISGYDKICPGENGRLQVQFGGAPPWSFTYSIDGVEAGAVRDIRVNPYPLPVQQEGTYELTSFNDGRCAGIGAGAGTVEVSNIEVRADIQPVSCNGLSDGKIELDVRGGTFPYSYQWDQGRGDRSNLQNVEAGTYKLTVTDADGCQVTYTYQVGSPAPLQPVTFECLDLGTDSILFTTNGGTPPYRFSVDGINYSDRSLFRQLEEGRFYTLIIRDQKGCRLEQDFIMPANTNEYIELTREVQAILGERFQLNPQLLIPTSLVERVRWSPPTHLSCVDCLQPSLDPQDNRTYTVRVTDKFGCWDEATVIVNVNRRPSVFIPSAFSPNNDGSNDHFLIFADPDQVNNVKKLQVYNRWGNLLFEVRDVQPNDPAYGWDGRFRGQFQKPGVYLFVAEIELVNGSTLMETGDVVLMR